MEAVIAARVKQALDKYKAESSPASKALEASFNKVTAHFKKPMPPVTKESIALEASFNKVTAHFKKPAATNYQQVA